MLYTRLLRGRSVSEDQAHYLSIWSNFALDVSSASLPSRARRVDAVEAAEAAKRTRGDAEGAAGVFVARIDAGGAFDALAFYFVHRLLPNGVELDVCLYTGADALF